MPKTRIHITSNSYSRIKKIEFEGISNSSSDDGYTVTTAEAARTAVHAKEKAKKLTKLLNYAALPRYSDAST